MSVLDLPRDERMKQRWTMLVSIITGPHEPETHINAYLRPMVDFLQLYNGILMQDSTGADHTVRAVLLGVAADLPASRKVSISGTQSQPWMLHLSIPGKERVGNRISYYTPANFPSPMRDNAQVRQQAEEYEQAYLQSDKRAREVAQKNGCRASELLRLPNFYPVRMFPVDPMNIILTGLIQNETSLHFNLPDVSDLTDQGMKIFQERVNHLEVPHDVGRLPVDISDPHLSLSGLRAAQWLHYAITYARICLYQQLNPGVCDFFKTLIQACEIVFAYSLCPMMSVSWKNCFASTMAPTRKCMGSSA